MTITTAKSNVEAPQESTDLLLRRKIKKDAKQNTTSIDADTTKTAVAAPLPLGWTQVKRKKRKRGPTKNDNDFMEWCCDDPSCPKPSDRNSNNSISNNNNNNNNKQSAAESQEIVWEGQAIICLHEMDSSWFQGYFVPKSSTKPWGLLGVQEEIDECLECADGGYKQITLSVFPPSLTTSTKRNKQSWKHVEWTGGDMMTLKSSFEGDNIRKNKKVEMYTDKMFTGPKAVPYVNQYFVSIVNKLRNAINKDDDDYDDDSDDSDDTSLSSSTKNTSTSLGVLDLIPDVAILTGPMSIVLPKSKNNDDDDTT